MAGIELRHAVKMTKPALGGPSDNVKLVLLSGLEPPTY